MSLVINLHCPRTNVTTSYLIFNKMLSCGDSFMKKSDYDYRSKTDDVHYLYINYTPIQYDKYKKLLTNLYFLFKKISINATITNEQLRFVLDNRNLAIIVFRYIRFFSYYADSKNNPFSKLRSLNCVNLNYLNKFIIEHYNDKKFDLLSSNIACVVRNDHFLADSISLTDIREFYKTNEIKHHYYVTYNASEQDYKNNLNFRNNLNLNCLWTNINIMKNNKRESTVV